MVSGNYNSYGAQQYQAGGFPPQSDMEVYKNNLSLLTSDASYVYNDAISGLDSARQASDAPEVESSSGGLGGLLEMPMKLVSGVLSIPSKLLGGLFG